MMTKVKTKEKSKKNDSTAKNEEISNKPSAKQTKVDRRRSIEDYVAKKRWKEKNEEIADLYDAECY